VSDLERFAAARFASLATVFPGGRPHVVPVTFALADGDVVIAVDHKPKSTRRLQRITNIEANAAVAVLADHRDADWRLLWWVRVDGTATVSEVDDAAVAALVAKYEQYREVRPAGPVIRIRIDRVSGWSAS
jgi:PPOX class probable F420-dependent enzyme